MTPVEEWRTIPEYDGRYEVSNLGRVRSFVPHIAFGSGPRLVGGATAGRYPRVHLTGPSGQRQMAHVHVLVLTAFVGPRPEGLVARHLDGDSTNNAASNLAWGTQSENIQDKRRHGTNYNLNKTHCPLGHPYAGDNLIVRPSGKRNCRACRRRWRKTKAQGRVRSDRP